MAMSDDQWTLAVIALVVLGFISVMILMGLFHLMDSNSFRDCIRYADPGVQCEVGGLRGVVKE